MRSRRDEAFNPERFVTILHLQRPTSAADPSPIPGDLDPEHHVVTERGAILRSDPDDNLGAGSSIDGPKRLDFNHHGQLTTGRQHQETGSRKQNRSSPLFLHADLPPRFCHVRAVAVSVSVSDDRNRVGYRIRIRNQRPVAATASLPASAPARYRRTCGFVPERHPSLERARHNTDTGQSPSPAAQGPFSWPRSRPPIARAGRSFPSQPIQLTALRGCRWATKPSGGGGQKAGVEGTARFRIRTRARTRGR